MTIDAPSRDLRIKPIWRDLNFLSYNCWVMVGTILLLPAGGPAIAFDVKSIPEVADFQGRNDPLTAPSLWGGRIDRQLDDVVSTVKNRPNLTTDVSIPGESVREHMTGAAGDPVFGTKIGEILRGNTLPENVRDTNPYARVTAKTEAKLRESILAAPKGSLTPAKVMDMALDATNGNYPLATLTAHSVLKSATIQGRDVIKAMNARVATFQKSKASVSQAEFDRQMDELRDKLRPHAEIASRLESLRADPTAESDKLGPWYHTFGVMSLGTIHGGVDATGGVIWEHGSKWMDWFGKAEGGFNPEKATIDAKVAARVLNPWQLGGFERDWSIAGPHPSKFIPEYFDDDPILKEEAREARCKAAMAEADAAMGGLKGSVSAAKILNARSKIPALNGHIAECPEMAGKIATIEKVAAVAADSIIQRGQAALSSCDTKVVNDAAGEVAALAGDPRVPDLHQKLIAEAGHMDSVRAEAQSAIAAFQSNRDGGDFFGMEAPLQRAKASLASVAHKGCFEKARARVDELIGKIANLRPKFDAANAALGGCDLAELHRLRTMFQTGTSVPSQRMVQNVASAHERCMERKKTAATSECRGKLGEYARADVSDVGLASCRCADDYFIGESSGQCEREMTKEEIAGARAAHCSKEFGAAYGVGTVLEDGRFYCKPSKSAANAHCRSKYGKAWYAGEVNGTGAYDCHRAASSARRRPRGRTRSRSQPSPSDAAAAAAAAAAIGAAIINQNRARNRRSGKRRKCHRNPNTGQMHCSGG